MQEVIKQVAYVKFYWIGMIEIIAIPGIPLVNVGDDLATLIYSAAQRCGLTFMNGDIVVVAHTIVSKAEGRIVKATDIKPSQRAVSIALINGFDPLHVELAIRESRDILRDRYVLITENTQGMVCNFSGVDRSNAPPDSYILLPEDADRSADRIRRGLEKLSGVRLAVIVSDTQGRPWRRGNVNLALGCSGIGAFKYNRGRYDLYGRVLQRSTVCQVDELAAAAEPVMGQAAEGTPAVIVRGYFYEDSEEHGNKILRPRDQDMFR